MNYMDRGSIVTIEELFKKAGLEKEFGRISLPAMEFLLNQEALTDEFIQTFYAGFRFGSMIRGKKWEPMRE